MSLGNRALDGSDESGSRHGPVLAVLHVVMQVHRQRLLEQISREVGPWIPKGGVAKHTFITDVVASRMLTTYP